MGSNPAGLTKRKATLTGWLFRLVKTRRGFGYTTCKGVGERSEWCPSGAFAEGENEVSESSETRSGLQRKQEPLRRLSLRKNPAGRDPNARPVNKTKEPTLVLLCYLLFCKLLCDSIHKRVINAIIPKPSGRLGYNNAFCDFGLTWISSGPIS